MRSKLLHMLVLVILCMGTTVFTNAEDSPPNLSFEVVYEIHTPIGRFVFSEEPIKVELIRGMHIFAKFGHFYDFDLDEDYEYELRYFLEGTTVAFIYSENNTLKKISLDYYCRDWFQSMRNRLSPSYELLLSENVSDTWGMSLDINGQYANGSYHYYFPVYVVSQGLPAPQDIRSILLTSRFEMGNNVYTVNGISHTTDAAPFIDTVYNRTMIPIRAVSEALDIDVTWNSETRTVNISTEIEIFRLPVDIPLPNDMGTPVIHENRVFVPLRYVAEILGATIKWDSENSAVYIYQYTSPV